MVSTAPLRPRKPFVSIAQSRLQPSPCDVESAMRLFCWTRKSIAECTPARSRPGTGRSRGCSDPPVSTTHRIRRSDARRENRHRSRRRAQIGRLPPAFVTCAYRYTLFELEVRYSKAQKTTDAWILLDHDDVVTGPGKLLRARQPGGAG